MVDDARLRSWARREFIRTASAGTAIAALGGVYTIAEDGFVPAARADGRPRVPPGQRVIQQLKPMGGAEGDPSRSAWKFKVHGEVEKPYEIDFRELYKMPQVTKKLDVHCVTGWSRLDAEWKGVLFKTLAERAKVKDTARHVVFEAARGYTTNVRLDEAINDKNMLAHRLDGKSLPVPNGAPVRGVVPDLYFWKSAKWITGMKFVRRDEPGYWEVRGYNNHADPWKEERYS